MWEEIQRDFPIFPFSRFLRYLPFGPAGGWKGEILECARQRFVRVADVRSCSQRPEILRRKIEIECLLGRVIWGK